MLAINFSDARKRLKDVIDTAVNDVETFVITRRDSEDAVLMSHAHYNSLMETVHLLGNPANAAHLAASIAQHRKGELVEHGLINAE